MRQRVDGRVAMKTAGLFAVVLAAVLFAGCAQPSQPLTQNASPGQLGPAEPNVSSPPANQTKPSPPPPPPPNASVADCASHAAAVLYNINLFNESRGEEEANCSRLTGTDKLACFDTSSCQLACYGSWLCRQQAWNLDISFINLIRDWRTDLKEIDDSIEIIRATLSLQPTRAGAGTVLQRVRGMRQAVARIKANRLFTTCSGCLNFCPLSKFDEQALAKAEDEASLLSGCVS